MALTLCSYINRQRSIKYRYFKMTACRTNNVFCEFRSGTTTAKIFYTPIFTRETYWFIDKQTYKE